MTNTTNSPEAQPQGVELLPCPFCGVVPTRRDNVYRYGSIAEHPEGSHCPLNHTTIGITYWNARADLPRATGETTVEAWLPIESAPKTGESILLGHVNSVWEDEWYSPESAWLQTIEGGTREGEVPSHWRPMPEPPVRAATRTEVKGGRRDG